MCQSCSKKGIITTIAMVPFLLGTMPTVGNLIIQARGGFEASEHMSGLFASTALASEKKASKTKWTCPMHPHYIADEFGACPICGMDLVKLQTSDAGLGSTSTEQRTQVSVNPEIMQTMGVRLAKVEKSSFGRSIRSYGIVEENERLRLVLSTRVEGWVEKLNIKAVGDVVKKGDVLFELYSPTLLVSQGDYLNSYKKREVIGLEQLKNYGVQNQVIKKLEKTGEKFNAVPFYADQNGTVSEINITTGSYVKRGTTIAKIQDYSSVWVVVNVSEKDLSFISKNTKARVMFPNLPGKEIHAKVDYVYPTVDSKTRTGRVRLVIDNIDGKLRPGTYADVVFEVGVEHRVSIPSEAILKNESGSFVVVSLGEGRFEPRAIKLGLNSSKWAEVKNGLKTGEEIVVSGQFLLDSESALRESFRKLERLQLPLSLVKLNKTEFAMIDHMVDAAMYIHEALVDGYDVEAKFLAPAVSIKNLMWPRYKNTKLSFVLYDAEKAIKKAQIAKTESELKAALNTLIIALKPWMTDGAPDHYKSRKVTLFEENETGLLWIQNSAKPLNPYSNASSKVIPWQIKKKEQKVEKTTAQKPEKGNQMRGSHGGSHGG